MDSGVKVESMGEAELAAVNVLSQKTGMNGLVSTFELAVLNTETNTMLCVCPNI